MPIRCVIVVAGIRKLPIRMQPVRQQTVLTGSLCEYVWAFFPLYCGKDPTHLVIKICPTSLVSLITVKILHSRVNLASWPRSTIIGADDLFILAHTYDEEIFNLDD